MGKWHVLHNPMAGYIAAKVIDDTKPVHSGNLMFAGEYTENKREAEIIAEEMNEKEMDL